MLQPPSPASPHDAARPGGDDVASEASSDSPEDAELPQCKIRRNYNCAKCIYFTQNPRQYLAHVRDAHDERIKIYDCPHCVYASRHQQKLLRHVRMIHSAAEVAAPAPPPPPPPPGDDAAEQDDADADVEMEGEAPAAGGDDRDGDDARSLHCAQCEFVAGEREELLKHERAAHARPNFFSCGKCNYVTHIKARFTKHVKYHSMPMIKCKLCDFRTPYKWNLDRHMKNHGGGGAFCCCMCNFTADIKQSLTVHEMNHHTPPAGHGGGGGRRRNKVGASDLLASAAAAASAASAAEEAMLVKDDGSTDSQSDVGSNHCTSDMASLNNESNDVTSDGCHESGARSPDAHRSFQNVCSALESLRQSRKLPRPIPQLIPLNCSTPPPGSARSSPTEPPLKRFKDMFSGNVDLDILNYSSTDIFKADRLPEAPAALAPSPATNATQPRKKNETFFDKLKERLLTETGANGSLTCKSCGFESKCLSEHSVHEKNCATHPKSVVPNAALPSLGSTRCQKCRHRCKSSADLYVHMQSCRARAAPASPERAARSQEESDQPHPMENVVFVWNTLSDSPERERSKLECPLDVNVGEDALLELGPRTYDPDNVDALHNSEASSLSPSQAGKRVFKCPHCPYWASTASRFHVHIVGHLNKKPFECSLCNYKSNWRWDITKHIRLKSVRDPGHNDAKVLMTDETGRRNYSKYSKYLATLSPNQQIKAKEQMNKKQVQDDVNADEPDNLSASSNDNSGTGATMPLNLQTCKADDEMEECIIKKTKRTLWKCKKCNYRDPSKEALLNHVRGHTKFESRQQINATTPQHKKQEPNSKDITESPALAYQCGHCNQLSNWKHVIQRHCRLKHNGVIKVMSVERPKQEPPELTLNDIDTDFCQKCPFKTNDKTLLFSHLQQHVPSPLSIFKCYFCPYFVKNQTDLMEHLLLHGISDPEEYVSKAMGCKSPLPEPVASVKRHKCTECPYETNSKSQFIYHEQFHRLPPSTPYKCQVCNYSVTKRHLLHQHMKVHRSDTRKESTPETDPLPVDFSQLPAVTITAIPAKKDDNSDEIPYVWVSAKNEFHKMYKCRYCSYVNSQQCKIPNHEKIHLIWYDNAMTVYKCLECKYTCDSAARLTDHSKFHGEIYGRIYYSVDPNVSDEEQIGKLRILLENEKQTLQEPCPKKEETTDREMEMDKMSDNGKYLYFCKKCPARFLIESEWNLHNRFHELRFSIQCKVCTYTVPQESQMAVHTFVHTDDYQGKTKMLQMMHDTHPNYAQPKLVSIKYTTSDELIWMIVNENNSDCSKDDLSLPSTSNFAKKSETKIPNKHYSCEHCPAKFFKSSALNYHLSLHGAEGGHTCKKCDYTVKNIGNLAKHEMIHDQDESSLTYEYKADYDSGEEMDLKNVPLSGTDLFQHKTEAQKRVHKDKLIMRPNDHFPPVLQADPQFGYLMHGNPEFIYPTYLKNGRQKEKRYKCHKCPSAFEKREQYKVHLSLHGSKQRYKCELCDYSVKYYANYVQHMRKHQMNAEAHAERNKSSDGAECLKPLLLPIVNENDTGNIKLAIKTIPKYTAKSDFMQFSIGDQQTLRLLQRRRSSASSCKDTVPTELSPEKDKKVHMCVYCPYTNQRRDALENHERRHKGVSGLSGNYECTYCDFTCNQSHFQREHLKSHFNAHKNTTPQCYVQNEGVVLTVTKLVDDENGETTEISFAQPEIYEEDACSKIADRIYVQPSTGEIAV